MSLPESVWPSLQRSTNVFYMIAPGTVSNAKAITDETKPGQSASPLKPLKIVESTPITDASVVKADSGMPLIDSYSTKPHSSRSKTAS